jgi:Villin headpiece domain
MFAFSCTHFPVSLAPQDAEFESVLKMDKTKFRGLSKWKQTQLKKDHTLF